MSRTHLSEKKRKEKGKKERKRKCSMILSFDPIWGAQGQFLKSFHGREQSFRSKFFEEAAT